MKEETDEYPVYLVYLKGRGYVAEWYIGGRDQATLIVTKFARKAMNADRFNRNEAYTHAARRMLYIGRSINAVYKSPQQARSVRRFQVTVTMRLSLEEGR